MKFRNNVWKILNQKIYLDELIPNGFFRKLIFSIVNKQRKRLTSSASISLIIHSILLAGYFGISELEKQIEPTLREISFIDLSEETILEVESPESIAIFSKKEKTILSQAKPEIVANENSNIPLKNPINGEEKIFLDSKRKQAPIRIERVESVAENLINPNDVLKPSLAKGIKNDEQIARPIQFDLNKDKKLILNSNSSVGGNFVEQVNKTSAIILGGNSLPPRSITNSPVTFKNSTPAQIKLDDPKINPKSTQTFITGPLANRTVLNKMIPAFPLWAKIQGVGAVISIKFTVMENGKVKEIAIVEHTSGSSEWDQLVVTALKQWKFAALDKADVRHDQTGVITFQFVI